MLPFLNKNRQGSGVIVKQRQPDEPTSDKSPDSSEEQDLEHCVKEIIKAYQVNDIKKIAHHIKIIHDVLHAYMDESSEDSESYDSLNAKAAEQE